MKRKVRPVVKGKHIPSKAEDINIIASSVGSSANFNKPKARIEKFVSKGDKVT